jgi:hypothetical protein
MREGVEEEEEMDLETFRNTRCFSKMSIEGPSGSNDSGSHSPPGMSSLQPLQPSVEQQIPES